LKNSRIHVFTGLILTVLLLSFGANAQDLEKKYASILGDYEFDVTDYGMGIVTVKYYVENDVLWAYPDNADEPGEMVPVEGEEFVFTVDAGDQGIYEMRFLKDESGEYTKCHVINEAMGMDVTGEKIKE
jgi:hypothetical protein